MEESPPRPNRQLRFHDDPVTRVFPGRQVDSAEEVTSHWYTRQDFHLFKRDAIFSARRISQAVATSADVSQSETSATVQPLDHNENDCIVGIERLLSPDALRSHMANKQNVVIAVLNEQARQRMNGEDTDPELLARASQTWSSWASNMSRIFARTA